MKKIFLALCIALTAMTAFAEEVVDSERDSIRPTKTLRNGRLIIWRNGHRYNTMGVDMKD